MQETSILAEGQGSSHVTQHGLGSLAYVVDRAQAQIIEAMSSRLRVESTSVVNTKNSSLCDMSA